MSTKMKIFDVIKEDLTELETALLKATQSDVGLITEIGTHLVQAGGKRLRPALYFLAARSGENYDRARSMPLGVALEMVHMASLVHDDVIDHADTRRGKVTANAKWGNQLAVLSGDYLFAKSFYLVIQNDYSKLVNSQLASLICDLSVGEIIQNKETFKACIDEEEYYERIARKTANFLAVACQLGADVAGLPEEDVDALYDFGYCIGMAFQLTDDVLDLVSDTEKLGKPAGNDILQGIITLPAIRALINSPHRDELLGIVTNKNMTPEELARAIEIVKASDGIQYTREKVSYYLDTARNVLPKSLPADVREAYLMAVNFIAARDF